MFRESAVADPEWHKAGRVHDWRNYISETVRGMWATFTIEQRIALAEQADDHASREQWD